MGKWASFVTDHLDCDDAGRAAIGAILEQHGITVLTPPDHHVIAGMAKAIDGWEAMQAVEDAWNRVIDAGLLKSGAMLAIVHGHEEWGARTLRLETTGNVPGLWRIWDSTHRALRP